MCNFVRLLMWLCKNVEYIQCTNNIYKWSPQHHGWHGEYTTAGVSTTIPSAKSRESRPYTYIILKECISVYAFMLTTYPLVVNIWCIQCRINCYDIFKLFSLTDRLLAHFESVILKTSPSFAGWTGFFLLIFTILSNPHTSILLRYSHTLLAINAKADTCHAHFINEHQLLRFYSVILFTTLSLFVAYFTVAALPKPFRYFSFHCRQRQPNSSFIIETKHVASVANHVPFNWFEIYEVPRQFPVYTCLSYPHITIDQYIH